MDLLALINAPLPLGIPTHTIFLSMDRLAHFGITDAQDPHLALYDVDDASTVVTLADWYHNPSPAIEDIYLFGDGGGNHEPIPDSGLINGAGRYVGGSSVTRSRINVVAGKRYRLRVINTSVYSGYEFSIEGHSLTIIEVDGISHVPLTVDRFMIYVGQRYSVVLTANQAVKNYWIRAPMSLQHSSDNDNLDTGNVYAVLHYNGAPSAEPTTSPGSGSGTLLQEYMLAALVNPGAPGGSAPADRTIDLQFSQDNDGRTEWKVNGIRYESPVIPTLLNIINNGYSTEADFNISEHTYVLARDQVVDLVIHGSANGHVHPFHLHGHAFDVVQSQSGPANYVNPPRRDVVGVGSGGGTVIIRFKTDNPGPCYVGNPYANSRVHIARNYITTQTVGDSYDFIVAGGGLAGLTIASRLTEDLNDNVLVLEAGQTGDAVKDSISEHHGDLRRYFQLKVFLDPPAGTYYNTLVGTSYDWQHKTTQQDNLGNRVISWPRGKVLGGSSAINGMYYVRPGQAEFDGWNAMLDHDGSAPTWDWKTMQSSMMKSEIFIPPSSDVQNTANIRFNAKSYGSTGRVHVSYPGFMYEVVGDWTPSFEAIGITPAADPAGGSNTGGFVSTVSINPTNWTRSYAKSAFIDPLPPRANLDILVSATVTRIVFGDNADSNGDKVATGVEFATSENGARTVVKANKEVILTGGALGSPNILMHSGVGPKDVLDAAGVKVVVELPGVGQRLQDHLVAPVVFKSKVETAGDIEASGSAFSVSPFFKSGKRHLTTYPQKEPMTMSFINSAIAYINASTLFDDSASLSAEIAAALDSSASTLVPSQYNEVVEGYKAIYTTTQKLVDQDVGQVELLLSINAPGTIAIQAAIQHPYSQGRAYINSASPFDPIVIDPNYFSHPTGLKLARKLSLAAPLSAALGDETTPGADVSTDDQIEAWLKTVVSTEYHPQGTCSMLPKAQGGVVNAQLQVYGLGTHISFSPVPHPLIVSGHAQPIPQTSAEATTTTSSGSPLQTSTKKNGSSARFTTSPQSLLAMAGLFATALVASTII
ncbi:hypothetical protein DXG01_017085 [Tephrocybe rancida]|nr:hypothetical protein DXG01_017085 [Tephrocybe rancida]